MVDLVSTGISGLDAMLYGGIPKDNQVIVAGGPGAGKTLMAFEFLYRNAKAGDTSLFFSLEEDPKRIINNAKSAFPEFRDIDRVIESKKLIVTGSDITSIALKEDPAFEFGRLIADIEEEIEGSNATRAVLDSSSALELIVRDPTAYRRSMWALVANFRRLGVTSILTSEIHSPDRSRLAFRPEHFIFDGMVVLYQGGEEARRVQSLEVIKMRGYKHSFVTAPYDITPRGFKVLSPESMNR